MAIVPTSQRAQERCRYERVLLSLSDCGGRQDPPCSSRLASRRTWRAILGLPFARLFREAPGQGAFGHRQRILDPCGPSPRKP